VPFSSSVPIQISGGTYGWVGEGGPKPVGSLQFTSGALTTAKSAGITVISDELVRAGTPAAETVVRNDLVKGIAGHIDSQLVDPTVAAVSGVNPGSITNLAPSIGSAGTSAANALTDAKALLAAFFSVNPDPGAAYWIMSPRTASALAIASNSQTLTVSGGTFLGLPAVVSQSAGARLIVVDAAALLVADDNEMDISLSRQANVEMSTVPTSPATASTVTISLWQHGLLGVRTERVINWKLARANACVYSVVNYV
jgi:HK97 family phage major capsid protein